MSARTHTLIAVFQGGEAFASTLEHLIEVDDGLADEQDEITAALSTGEAYVGGGGAAATFAIVNLGHRDAPHHAADALTISEMNDLLRVFCAARGLPHKSADELLAGVFNHDLGALEVINWLSAFVDAYMDHRDYGKEVAA
jgi:hypothetical protein